MINNAYSNSGTILAAILLEEIINFGKSCVRYCTKSRCGVLPDTASYALLCVYRPYAGLGVVVQYNLHVNDSMVCRVKNGSSYEVKIYSPGQAQLWARTEKRTEIMVDFQPGKAYFLRCSVGVGALVGRPVFEIMDDYNGVMEFKGVKVEKPADSEEDPVYSGVGR